MKGLEMIEGLKKKDERALSLLYDQYSSPLLGIICRIIGNRDAAEEVLQQTILKIWSNINSYDPAKAPFFSWIATIARNAARDRGRLKSFQYQQKTESLDPTVHNVESTEMNSSSLDVSRLTGILAPKYKEVVDIIYLMGYTHQEAAAKLDLPLGTVKTRLRQAIKLLADELKDEKGLFMAMIMLILLMILIL